MGTYAFLIHRQKKQNLLLWLHMAVSASTEVYGAASALNAKAEMDTRHEHCYETCNRNTGFD